MRHYRFRLLVVVFASLIGSTSAATAREVPSGTQFEAIWHIQEFDFYYHGVRGHYHSCSSLRSKISGIMEAMGAESVVVRIACSRDALVDSTVARVATAMPVQATPENIVAATTFDTHQEMIARLRQTQLPTAGTIERFPAEWRRVAITSVGGARLGPEDCELLHDLHEQILPHLTSVRVLRKSFACGSPNLRPMRPILIVEALMRRDA